MAKKNEELPEVKNFEAEQILADHHYIRDMYSLLLLKETSLKVIFTKVKLRGCIHIQNKCIGEEKVNVIENNIHELLREHGIPVQFKTLK